MSRAATARPLEAQCEDAIIEAAILAGWLVHAERPAQTKKGHRTAIKGHAGWPDLVLSRRGQFMIVELKRKPNKPDIDQLAWLDSLRVAGIDARLVWVPEEMGALIAELTQPPKEQP